MFNILFDLVPNTYYNYLIQTKRYINMRGYMKNTVNKLLPRIKPNLFSSSSMSIFSETLEKVREKYEEYYHFDSVFVCVDEKTLEIIEVEYE